MELKCPYFKECGGCNYLDISYEEELKNKGQMVKKLFDSIGYKKDIEIIENDKPYFYRNKVIVAFKLSKTGKVTSGIYEEGTKKIVPVNNCLIQAEAINELLLQLHEVLNKNKIKPFGYGGVLKHALIRYGFKTKELLLTLVTSEELFPGRNNIVKDLTTKNKNIKTIIQNIQSRNTPVVLGDKERILYGTGFIYDYLDNLKFKISSKSFYQINPVQTVKLYQEAINFADIQNGDIVLDTYSGIGTIGLFSAKNAKKVYLVENNKDAHKDSIGNAKLNNVGNAEAILADSTKFLVDLAETKDKIDVLFLDPPRDGSTKEFIEAVSKLKIKKVVYISCNPKTQIRDLKWFMDNGYIIKNVKAFDQFSRTLHVESIALITRKN